MKVLKKFKPCGEALICLAIYLFIFDYSLFFRLNATA